MLYLHDVRDTSFSQKNIMRWWVVLSITGKRVRIAPRSASARGGVSVPRSAMSEFSKDGRVPRVTRTISLAVAVGARNIGPVPQQYFQAIQAQFVARQRPGTGGAP